MQQTTVSNENPLQQNEDQIPVNVTAPIDIITQQNEPLIKRTPRIASKRPTDSVRTRSKKVKK